MKPQNGNITINWEEMDKLLAIHCTLVEISDFFDCSEDTIERIVQKEKDVTFAEYSKKKRGAGKRSLRRKQIELALSGNPTMLIWLGKQYLEQADSPIQIESTHKTDFLTEKNIDDIIRISKKLVGID